MLLPDVNVLVAAFRKDLPEHAANAEWLRRAAVGGEVVGLCDPVLTGFVRIVTHPRIFNDPSPTPVALDFCGVLLAHPNFQAIRPGPRTWKVFGELLRETGGRGNHVPDAWFAAVAIVHEATWVSNDSDFARYQSLRWVRP